MSIEKIAFKGSEIVSQIKSGAKSGAETQTYAENKEKSYAAKLMIGATALAGVVALGVAGYKGHLGSKVQKLLGGTVKPQHMQETTTLINIEQSAAENPVAMKMNDDAKKIYEGILETCDGKIEVNVNDTSTKTLTEMAEYYAKEEKISAFPKLLKDFETEINATPTKELWNIKFKNFDEITSYREIIRQRYNDLPWANHSQKLFSDYDKYSNVLNEYERAEFNHLRRKDKLIEELIQNRKDTLLENHLRLKGDNPVHCKRINEYIYDDEKLNAFGLYYDAYPYNDALRAGRSLDADVLQHIKAMDSVFERAPELEESSVVYRAVHGNQVYTKQNDFCNSLKEGMIINDKSYVSTSTDIENPQFLQFANGVIDEGFGTLMRIKLPKGTKGVLGGLNEYLLPRNSQIKINKIETINGVKIADCEYILPKV